MDGHRPSCGVISTRFDASCWIAAARGLGLAAKDRYRCKVVRAGFPTTRAAGSTPKRGFEPSSRGYCYRCCRRWAVGGRMWSSSTRAVPRLTIGSRTGVSVYFGIPRGSCRGPRRHTRICHRPAAAWSRGLRLYSLWSTFAVGVAAGVGSFWSLILRWCRGEELVRLSGGGQKKELRATFR